VLASRGNLEHLAGAAAERALALIREIGANKSIVHLGLGAGWTTMLVAQHLAMLLRSADRVPRLRIHALSSGFDVENPFTAPIYFFGFFANLGIDVTFVSLFAPAFVDSTEYKDVKRQPGVADSFRQADEIDIVITSLASAADEHGDLKRFVQLGSTRQQTGKAVLNRLERAGWIGDVQYRPYNAAGPLDLDEGNRAVVLLELEDLVRLAATPDKRVILVAGPCSLCDQLRADALRPLLAEPKLRVWTDLLMDLRTAQALVNPDTERLRNS
jgi:DNA-binding transcriptional regulator LsrR (DeoR family)